MNPKIKSIISIIAVVLLSVLLAGCGTDATPYVNNDAEGYDVSVKYDANGGTFTTNTSVIVDSYNISDLETNGEGMAEIALLSPDDPARGHDSFTPIKNGAFLAGWYSERTETTDADGNTVYTYSGKWDFENDSIKVDPAQDHTSSEPQITLYAAWVPLFEIEFYSLDSGEYLDSYVFDPTIVESILLPEWDEETGAIEMHNFPKRSGYTFNKAYLDEKGSEALEGDTLTHIGNVDYETGTATDSSMKLYVDWTEGEWFRIYNTEQFLDNASVNGNYEILADLDFTDEIWPTSLMYGNFSGTIKGNGHTFKNVEAVQTNNSKVNAGLFGQITENAEITDLTFENVSFTVKAGTRVIGTSYGLFAGTLSSGASVEKVNILGSTLAIDSSCYFASDDYTIGLVCGMGDPSVVETADISVAVVGDNPETLTLTVNNNTVTVEQAQ